MGRPTKSGGVWAAWPVRPARARWRRWSYNKSGKADLRERKKKKGLEGGGSRSRALLPWAAGRKGEGGGKSGCGKIPAAAGIRCGICGRKERNSVKKYDLHNQQKDFSSFLSPEAKLSIEQDKSSSFFRRIPRHLLLLLLVFTAFRNRDTDGEKKWRGRGEK